MAPAQQKNRLGLDLNKLETKKAPQERGFWVPAGITCQQVPVQQQVQPVQQQEPQVQQQERPRQQERRQVQQQEPVRVQQQEPVQERAPLSCRKRRGQQQRSGQPERETCSYLYL